MAEGYADYTPNELDLGREMIIPHSRYVVRRDDLKKYFSDSFYNVITLWNIYRRRGLPFSGGWAEQPDKLMRALLRLDDEIDFRERDIKAIENGRN